MKTTQEYRDALLAALNRQADAMEEIALVFTILRWAMILVGLISVVSFIVSMVGDA